MNQTKELHHIIIVGGGAGGLELASMLGKTLGKKKKALITLVDVTLTHLWKPLLHEVAAGSLNSYEDELSYLAQAYWNHFQFRLGYMDKLDREKQEISLAPTLDAQGDEYIPRRTFHYDSLIMAVGSVTNDFSITGVREHCMFLDTRSEADSFHQNLLRKFYAAHTKKGNTHDKKLNIAIAGAGATGVELSAELHAAALTLIKFGLDQVQAEDDVKIHLIEASARILPHLPARLSDKTKFALEKLNINILTNTRITEATAEGFKTTDGKLIPASIKVWAAGIKAPQFLKEIDGLETNHINQLVVKSTLQTTRDDNIFALGDCASCPMSTDQETGKVINVPPRAQAAHQQASLLVKTIRLRIQNNTNLPEYKYIDFGSLVSMGEYSAVGNLMGNVAKFSGTIMVEGIIARFVYMSLYKMHQIALHGTIRTALSTLANLLTRGNTPRMKLH